MSMNKLTQTITLTLVLSGCSLAPHYQAPDVPLSEQWVGIALKDQQKNSKLVAERLGWRDYFLDPHLQGLISTALTYNHDLRKAALNIELAQAQYQIQESQRLPTVVASAKSERAMSRDIISQRYNVGLGIANFELDFFGRVKNLGEQALNKYLATKEARDAAQQSIINNVAKAYYKWRVSDALKQLAQRTLNTRRQTYKLTKLRFREGIAAGTDLTAARSAIASAQSSYQKQLRETQQTANTLAVLVGQPLSSLNLPKPSSLTRQFPRQKLFVDIPSNVLLNRPDIRQAEYGLKGANANIGAARAALFPSISLTGNTGYSSNQLDGLVNDNNQIWSFSPSISLPIFDYGRRQANVKVAEINQKILVEDYQQTVQAAFRDVNDALIARQTLDKQYRAERRAQSAARETLRLIRLQVKEGLSDGLRLLDVERNDFVASQSVLLTQLLRLNNRVDLYTALGGGLKENTNKNVKKTQKP